MKFVLTINTDNNESVQTRNDVAWLLDSTARKLRSNTQIMSAPILDTADVKVGEWTIEEPEVTPVYGIPIYEPPET